MTPDRAFAARVRARIRALLLRRMHPSWRWRVYSAERTLEVWTPWLEEDLTWTWEAGADLADDDIDRVLTALATATAQEVRRQGIDEGVAEA